MRAASEVVAFRDSYGCTRQPSPKLEAGTDRCMNHLRTYDGHWQPWPVFTAATPAAMGIDSAQRRHPNSGLATRHGFLLTADGKRIKQDLGTLI